MDEKTKAVLDCIMSRSSIRKFTPKKVDNEKVELMLRAGMAAPSACNKQPWRFMVIEDTNVLNRIGSDFSNASMAKGAPLAIIVFGDRNDFFEGDGELYWVQDCAAATENILLAAHCMDLGAVWCGIFPRQERCEKMSQMFGLPENIVPFGVIVVGYPAEAANIKDKWKPEYIRYENWQ